MKDMKRKVAKYCVALSALIIALSFHVDDMLVKFLLAGEIPGTKTSLSPSAMLAVFAMLILLPLILRAYRRYDTSFKRSLEQAKARLPKRRYSSLS